MLRDKALVPLSHQHHHALALCVRIQRALANGGEEHVRVYEEEVTHIFDDELEAHFEAEEQVLFPAASVHEGLRPVLEQLHAEHTKLRIQGMQARHKQLHREGLLKFADTLSTHIRTEERVLFEECQRLMSGEELQRLGDRAADFFRERGVSQSCRLPDAI